MPTDDPKIHDLSRILTGLQIGTYEWRPQADVLLWSPELVEIYGLDRGPATEQEFGALLHPEDRTRVEGETSAFLGSDVTRYSHVFRIVRPDGGVRAILDRGSITRDRTGKATLICGANIDVTDDIELCRAVEERLRAGEGRYRKLFDAIDEGFCIVEVRLDAPDGRIDYRVIEANPAFYAKTGFPQSILGAWLREAAPALEEHWYQTYGSVARTGQPIRFENSSELLGRWFDVYAFPIDDPADHHVAILFNDISDRKQLEDQNRLLVDEVSHRSKNLLGVIQAIARQSAMTGADDFLERFTERVRSLAASNDLLVRNGWSAVSLADLVRSQLAPFSGPSGDRIEVDVPPISLTPEATKALGMALHELATNAAKYGALSNEAGRISVIWSIRPDGPMDHGFAISWLERGGPPVDQPTKHGFGSKVTTQIVEGSTGGKVSVDYAPDGLAWRFAGPAAKIVV